MKKTIICLAALAAMSQNVNAQCPNPPDAPLQVTANPDVVCSDTGTVADLSGVSSDSISWYTVATGGTSIGTSLSGANFSVNPMVTTTYYAEAFEYSVIQADTFFFTGNLQNFTVPNGITSIQVEVIGASGGAGNPAGSTGGNGGTVEATLSVTPGEILNIEVGGEGASATNGGAAGYNGGGTGAVGSVPSYSGGGGGGASDIRVSPYALSDRIIVAGGGGGGGADGCTANALLGGDGGGLTAADGAAGTLCNCNPSGLGGDQSAGGIVGAWACGTNCNATPGSLGFGGNGNTSSSCGSTTGGAGGGGGYYGGGGGGLGAGGGGSSYTIAGASSVVHTQGSQTGDGMVVIRYEGICTSTSRTAVTVTINPLPTVAIAPVTEDTLCVDDNAVNLSATPTGGTFSGNGMTGNNFDPAAAGTGAHPIYYSFTDGNGCSNTDTTTMTVLSCAGLDKNELGNITVYPNPAENEVSFELNKSITGSVELQIYSSNGELIKTRKTTIDASSPIQINVSDLSPGIYHTKIMHKNGEFSVNWVKN